MAFRYGVLVSVSSNDMALRLWPIIDGRIVKCKQSVSERLLAIFPIQILELSNQHARMESCIYYCVPDRIQL